jgi:hypothetical protein
MLKLKLAGAAVALVMLASCATRTPQPPAPVPQQPPPRPAPPRPLPTPPPLAWQDAPLSAGDWSYSEAAGGPSASFGAPAAQFTVRCEPDRRISLTRLGATGTALTLRTSDALRALPASAEQVGLVAYLNAADPLLDAMAFSRGRFAVEVAGTPLLILPAWPEPARVIEQCRG